MALTSLLDAIVDGDHTLGAHEDESQTHTSVLDEIGSPSTVRAIQLAVRIVTKPPEREGVWRSIILFGRNTASYKFALGSSLLELAVEGKTDVTLEELARPYAAHIVRHLGLADRQAISPSSQFLDACRAFSRGDLGEQALTDATVRLGFNNVIDCFHNVNGDEAGLPFYHDERRTTGRVRLTDHVHELASTAGPDLAQEVEARWRLVETAWDLQLPAEVLEVGYDGEGRLHVDVARGGSRDSARRIDVTGCREALNGYQGGRCFYCGTAISVEPGHPLLADVDHFFPHRLQRRDPSFPYRLDGVWNLVLACTGCNRGQGGKSDRVPDRQLLERLHARNEYLIGSHHPLRETLRNQTGKTEDKRRRFVMSVDAAAVARLRHRWSLDA